MAAMLRLRSALPGCDRQRGAAGHTVQPARSPRTTCSSGGLLTLLVNMALKAAAETGRAK